MSASSKKKLRKELETAQLTEKQLAEQKEAKKFKTYTIAFVAVLALVLVFAIGIICVNTYNNSGIRERATDAVTIGSHTLSNAELNYFYIDAINGMYNEWYEQYGDYTEMYLSWMMGLDLTKPLNEQDYDEDHTYADYFVEKAIEDAKDVYAIYDAAIAANHICTDEQLADISETIEAMETYAQLNGVSFSTYLKAVYGKGANKNNLEKYLNVVATVNSYQTNYYDSLVYDEATLNAYDKDHFNEFSSFDYVTFLVDYEDFLTGGTQDKDGNTSYSDAEKEAALKAAEAVAKDLVASGANSADALDAAIKAQDKYKDKSSATSTKSTNSLYTSINEDIAQWLAEDDRKEGDISYIEFITTSTDADGVETEAVEGYYVVIMLNRNDNKQNLVNVRHILIRPTENSTNEDGTTYSSDEEWAEANSKIEAIRDEWLAGDKTEESFATLAMEKTEDGGSKTNGGLYEEVTPGAMVTEFNDWIFDSNRKTGDYDIVKTEYGYHLMYFSSHCDETYREHMIKSTMRENDFTAWHDGIVSAVSATVLDTSLVDLDFVYANS